MPHQIMAGFAILMVGIIYGTDVFCAVVQRSAMTRVSDETLTATMGYIHLYGDQRLRFPGALGALATIATTVTAILTDAGAAAVIAGFVAIAALAIWFVIYGRISAPINHRLTAAALAKEPFSEARALHQKWDSVITLRSTLQGVAVLSLFLSAVF